jgi:hypothetical protein
MDRMTTTMTPVALVQANLPNFHGTANLYRVLEVTDTFQAGDHFVASATDVPFSGPEVYLFRCDPTGKVTDWSELPGSSRGTLNIDEVLGDAGYVVIVYVD